MTMKFARHTQHTHTHTHTCTYSFSELTDPVEQRRRFEEQYARHQVMMVMRVSGSAIDAHNSSGAYIQLGTGRYP